MASLTNEQREYLEQLLRMTDFSSMYDVIHAEYKHRELGIGLADEERIAEYKYIVEQLRKYIGSHVDQIRDHGADLQGMLEEIIAMISTASEIDTERKKLVYSFMRDRWLLEVYNGIVWMMDQTSGVTEEDIDG